MDRDGAIATSMLLGSSLGVVIFIVRIRTISISRAMKSEIRPNADVMMAAAAPPNKISFLYH